MRTDITPAQIHRYQEDGFLVYEDLLSPGELADLRDAVTRATEVMGDRKMMSADGGWKDGDGYYDRVFVQRLNLWKHEPVVKRFMLGAGIGSLAGRLAGVDGMRVWHDQALNKMPWANPTSWHLDNPYWSFTSPHAISVWIALDDATLQNGCLAFLPGSHRLVDGRNVGIGPNFGDLFTVYPQLSAIEPVMAPMRAGSCSFHNGLTAHAAGVNLTPRWRRAMTCGYMPAGATFNGQQNILPKSRVERLKIGDPLDDEADNPLVWERSAVPA